MVFDKLLMVRSVSATTGAFLDEIVLRLFPTFPVTVTCCNVFIGTFADCMFFNLDDKETLPAIPEGLDN
jgi:hypothetical protein